jgi:hypothetical protein
MQRRAVCVTISRLLSDIIAEVAREEVTLELVAELDDRGALFQRLSALPLDLVLIGLHDGESDDICALARAHFPNALVLAFSNDLRRCYWHDARVGRAVLPDFSLAHLRAALYGAGS